MTELQIHLQEGFDHDTVALRVGGRETYRKADVTTRTQIGLADMTTVELPEGAVEIEVEVPTRGARDVIRVTLPDTLYVGISLDRTGRLVHHASAEMMGYV